MDGAANVRVRHHLDPDDASTIARVHHRVYCEEHGFVPGFADEVDAEVRAAIRRGWPEAGAVWLPELEDEVRGCLGLTFEGENARGRFVGRIRWFVLEPELRGCGLGRQLLAELFAVAADQGIDQLELTTFDTFAAAAHLYRSWGFSLIGEDELPGWRADGGAVRALHYVAHLSPVS